MTTRSILLAGLVTAAGLSACAVQTPEIGPSPSSAPLRAHLYVESGLTGGLMFDTNRPAYVAVFQVVPGQGTALVYPRPGYASRDGATFAGLHQVSLQGMRGSYYSFLRRPAGYAGPQFFFMIASEEPLDLERFGPVGNGLQSVLGVQFAAMNAYSTMERLAMAAVPNVESGNWTTDYYVYWPNTLYSTPRDNTVLVTCGGYSVYVPIDRVLEVQRALCSFDSVNEQERPEVPTDSTGTVEPQRRPPPEMVTERIASTQLERPEEYEVRRRAATAGRILDDVETRDVDGSRVRERVDPFGPSIRENPAVGRTGRSGSIGDRGTGAGGAASTGASTGVDRRPAPPAGRAEPRDRAPAPTPSPSPGPGGRPTAPRDNPPL